MKKRVVFGLLLSLSVFACRRVELPTPHLLSLPSGGAQPVCITDSTGAFCASIQDAGIVNDAQAYGVKVSGLAAGSYNMGGDVTGTTTANTVLGLTGTGTGVVNFSAADTTPTISQAINPSGGGVQMLVQAQAAKVGSGGNGGPLRMLSGAGDGAGTAGELSFGTADFEDFVACTSGTSPSVCQFSVGDISGVGQVQLVDSLNSFQDLSFNEYLNIVGLHTGATAITVATGVTGFTIKQADRTTNSGTGATTTIQGQNETGTTSNGGPLDLRSGTGTTGDGAITLRHGTTLVETINASGATFAQAVTASSTLTSTGTLTASAGFTENIAPVLNTPQTIACSTGGTQTVAASATAGLIVTTGTLSSNCTIDFGTNATSGFYTLDMSGATPGATFGIIFKNGTASSTTYLSSNVIVGSRQAAFVWTHGSNTLVASY